MTAALSLLTRGLGSLRGSLGESFTVEGLGSFVGLVPETRHGNEVGEGGWLPTQQGILTVERAEFEAKGVFPWIGMRVTINGRVHLVSEISTNPYCWVLTLMVAHPKETSDVPEFTHVISTTAGTPLHGPSNNPIVPQP